MRWSINRRNGFLNKTSKIATFSKVIIHIALLLLAAVLLVSVNMQSHQAMPSFSLPLTFEGVYSQNGGEWKSLDENTKFNALDGDLVLRGNFGERQQYLEEGTVISCYLDYIMITITINDEIVYGGYPYSEALIRDLCSKVWVTWETPQMGPEDEIEIRLHNPYRFGNADAYDEFLQMIYPGTAERLLSQFEKKTLPEWMTGFGMLICALVLLGMALAGFLQRHKNTYLFVAGGLMVLFAGCFVMLDTIDISLLNPNYVMNAYARQICLMLFIFELFAITRRFLSGTPQMIAAWVTAVSAGVDAVLMLVSLVSGRTLFGLMLPWSVVHVILLVLMVLLCVYQLWSHKGEIHLMLCGGCVLYATVLLEVLNSFTCWWEDLVLVKAVFTLLLLIYLVLEIRQIPRNYLAALREEKLAAELKESRVMLSLGQIRSHFIYNVLAAINYTGQQDAKKANNAVECFVRYLRSNVDVLQNDQLIPFEQELAHLRDYVALEKIHYDEEIRFEEQLEETDFLIPPLVLQPLVENAIHHGFDKMQRQGTIKLRVTRSVDSMILVVSDDGEGFDQTKPVREGAVGVGNVRFRLEHMIGGRMNIESHPGEGTIVTIMMPYLRDASSATTIAH